MSEEPYAQGGWLPPGTTWVRNETGSPMYVLSAEQVKALGADYLDQLRKKLRSADEDD